MMKININKCDKKDNHEIKEKFDICASNTKGKMDLNKCLSIGSGKYEGQLILTDPRRIEKDRKRNPLYYQNYRYSNEHDPDWDIYDKDYITIHNISNVKDKYVYICDKKSNSGTYIDPKDKKTKQKPKMCILAGDKNDSILYYNQHDNKDEAKWKIDTINGNKVTICNKKYNTCIKKSTDINNNSRLLPYHYNFKDKEPAFVWFNTTVY